MAKSRIKKGIIRKIRTADFEQLDVICEVEEEIEWNNEEERKSETEKLKNRLIEDFADTYNDILHRVGVDRCIGVVKTKGGMKSKTTSNEEFSLD